MGELIPDALVLERIASGLIGSGAVALEFEGVTFALIHNGTLIMQEAVQGVLVIADLRRSGTLNGGEGFHALVLPWWGGGRKAVAIRRQAL